MHFALAGKELLIVEQLKKEASENAKSKEKRTNAGSAKPIDPRRKRKRSAPCTNSNENAEKECIQRPAALGDSSARECPPREKREKNRLVAKETTRIEKKKSARLTRRVPL